MRKIGAYITSPRLQWPTSGTEGGRNKSLSPSIIKGKSRSIHDKEKRTFVHDSSRKTKGVNNSKEKRKSQPNMIKEELTNGRTDG